MELASGGRPTHLEYIAAIVLVQLLQKPQHDNDAEEAEEHG